MNKRNKINKQQNSLNFIYSYSNSDNDEHIGTSKNTCKYTVIVFQLKVSCLGQRLSILMEMVPLVTV